MRGLIIICFLIISGSSFAMSPEYFRQFIDKEIIVTVRVGDNKSFDRKMQVRRIDEREGVLVGRTNEGVAFIPVKDIISVVERPADVHSIFSDRM